jgi:hypothetical protein
LYFASERATAVPSLALDSFLVGEIVWVRCWSDAAYEIPYGSAWSIIWQADTPTEPAVPVEDIAQVALDSLRVPLPSAGLNPSGRQVVNVPTWLWVENWESISRTATVAGVSATVTATPVRQRWSFGLDGGTVTCAGPGVPYDASLPERVQRTDCALAFRRSSAGQQGGAFAVTVTVDWAVTWTSTVPGRGGGLGELSSTATQAVPVGEIQVLNS